MCHGAFVCGLNAQHIVNTYAFHVPCGQGHGNAVLIILLPFIHCEVFPIAVAAVFVVVVVVVCGFVFPVFGKIQVNDRSAVDAMVISGITQSMRKVYAYAGIHFVPSFCYTLNVISTAFINIYFYNFKCTFEHCTSKCTIFSIVKKNSNNKAPVLQTIYMHIFYFYRYRLCTLQS